MEKQYVDEFFNSGKLRIPSFKRFRSNTDEELGDPVEGLISAKIATPKGSHSIVAINGQEAYVLCATTVESKSLEAKFKTEYGFRILNSLGFSNSISSHIAGFVGGLEGLCSYRDETSINKSIKESFPPPESFSNPEVWSQEYDKFIGIQSRDAFFIKHAKYAHQTEYRFIWFAQGIEKEYIDIICPEARQFCQALNSNNSVQPIAKDSTD
jgi:hypothetical protein